MASVASAYDKTAIDGLKFLMMMMMMSNCQITYADDSKRYILLEACIVAIRPTYFVSFSLIDYLFLLVD